MAALPNGRNIVSLKSPLGRIYMSDYNFFVADQSSPTFFSPTYVEGAQVHVDQVLFRFSLRQSVPEIFVIKVESCQKSRRIFDLDSKARPDIDRCQNFTAISRLSWEILWRNK